MARFQPDFSQVVPGLHGPAEVRRTAQQGVPGASAFADATAQAGPQGGNTFPVPNRLSWTLAFPISGSPIVVTDRERQLSQDFWSRRGGQAPLGRRGRLQPKERIFVALGIGTAVLVVVMGILR